MAISKLERPQKVGSLLGIIGYYHRQVQDFARLDHQLALVLKENAKWARTMECDGVFSKLK